VFWNLLLMFTSTWSTSPMPGLQAAATAPWLPLPGMVATDAPADSVTTMGSGSMSDLAVGEPSFALHVGGEPALHPVSAAFVLPGEELALEIPALDAFAVHAAAGSVTADGPNRWSWRAPATPGLHPVHVTRADGASVTVNAFVMVPYSSMKRGVLNGYRIGAYPAAWSRRARGYERPRGFVEVTAENHEALVAPHFRLGQFVCKQGEGFPKYVVLQPRLIHKLEALLESARQNGVSATTFHLMSAYRTPVYNRGIGNKTAFSRHQYGDAADIFVDEFPADGVMDDINRDGRHDRGDARFLMGLADSLDRAPETGTLVGGLSAYHPTSSHGAFVHVDARGYAARW
jgi:hypothetical protein